MHFVQDKGRTYCCFKGLDIDHHTARGVPIFVQFLHRDNWKATWPIFSAFGTGAITAFLRDRLLASSHCGQGKAHLRILGLWFREPVYEALLPLTPPAFDFLYSSTSASSCFIVATRPTFVSSRLPRTVRSTVAGRGVQGKDPTVCLLADLFCLELHPSPVDDLVGKDGEEQDLGDGSRERFVKRRLQAGCRTLGVSRRQPTVKRSMLRTVGLDDGGGGGLLAKPRLRQGRRRTTEPMDLGRSTTRSGMRGRSMMGGKIWRQRSCS